jgi:polyisoprenoid-binding protein YceI
MSSQAQTLAPDLSTLPGYRPGHWVIDPTHSEIGFSVRHLMVSKVRGRFARFAGEVVTTPDPLDSRVEATVELASIDTNSDDRDTHLRSADFLDTDTYPTLEYHSTGIREGRDGLVLDGELSLHGVTRVIPLALEVHGFLAESPFGDSRVGFSARGEISRKDFGITFDIPLEGGGVGIGDRVQIALEIEAVLRPDAA